MCDSWKTTPRYLQGGEVLLQIILQRSQHLYAREVMINCMDYWVWICISIVLIEFHLSSINVQNLWNSVVRFSCLSVEILKKRWKTALEFSLLVFWGLKNVCSPLWTPLISEVVFNATSAMKTSRGSVMQFCKTACKFEKTPKSSRALHSQLLCRLSIASCLFTKSDNNSHSDYPYRKKTNFTKGHTPIRSYILMNLPQNKAQFNPLMNVETRSQLSTIL